jgi:2-keto-4-pentenoate hydratase/2-oxohepta-3-ene-1,7-dioic acid hydratase in catechol pathway
VGALAGDHVVDLAMAARAVGGQAAAAPSIFASLLDLIQAGAAGLGAARAALAHVQAALAKDAAAAQRQGLAHPRDSVHLLAPIPRPAKNIFCLGRNYAEHAAERGAAAPTIPVYFTKPSTTVIGPEADIIYHRCTKELDYEVELAAVIGLGGRNIPKDQALSHVFGYTILNDVTARDLQKAHGQWFKGKSLDTFAPMGPALVTADEVPDPQGLRVRLRVNGQERQNAGTETMIFGVATCIAVLSEGLTLDPGDIIATGTPAGVGAASNGLLKVGDVVEAEVTGLGVLRNRVVADRG